MTAESFGEETRSSRPLRRAASRTLFTACDISSGALRQPRQQRVFGPHLHAVPAEHRGQPFAVRSVRRPGASSVLCARSRSRERQQPRHLLYVDTGTGEAAVAVALRCRGAVITSLRARAAHSRYTLATHRPPLLGTLPNAEDGGSVVDATTRTAPRRRRNRCRTGMNGGRGDRGSRAILRQVRASRTADGHRHPEHEHCTLSNHDVSLLGTSCVHAEHVAF